MSRVPFEQPLAAGTRQHATQPAPVGAKRLLALLAIAYIALGALWTIRAPCGAWTNRLLDFGMWAENDPGGWYLPAAHEVFSKRQATSFVGHPGVPLVLLLYSEQAAFYGVEHLAGTPLAFTPFIARNAQTVWIVAKLSLVLMHILSFLALYQYSWLLAQRRDLALLATLTYATSFPVLYYLTRVSVEPIMNLFFLLTVVCLVKAEAALEAGFRREVWAAAAGLCAVSAFFTKLQLMVLWPALAGLGLLVGFGGAPTVHLVRRLRMLAAYGLAGGLLGTFYSSLVNWSEFRRYWQTFGRIEGPPTPDASLVTFLWASAVQVVGTVFSIFRNLKPSALLPSRTASGCFFLFECLAGLALVLGLAIFLRRKELRPRLLGWMVAYATVVAAAWFYRTGGTDFQGFHYLFPAIAALAPVVALGLEAGVLAVGQYARIPLSRPVLLGLGLLIMHLGGFWAVVDSRQQDASAFRLSGAPYYFAALRQVAPLERVAVIGPGQRDFHGLTDRDGFPGRDSALVHELDQTFVWKRKVTDLAEFQDAALRRHVGVVIDWSRSEPGPSSITDWARRPSVTGLEPENRSAAPR